MTITYARTTSSYEGAQAGMSASIPIADTIVASSSNFTIPAITGTITSWVYNGAGYPQNAYQNEAMFVVNIRIDGIETGQFLTFEKGYLSIGKSSGWASKSWTATSTAFSLITSRFFNSANKTARTSTITLSPAYWQLSNDCSTYSNNSTPSGTVTLMLDAPPTATLGTPTYATPHYVGLGAYTVPITSAEAYYGGDISKVTLTVGQDSTVQTYSTPTINNKTISVTSTMAGTYTPTVTVEDSRGQIATYTLPQITVNPYNVPSVSFDVYRTNNIGIKNDEGHYALIQSTISYTDAIATLTEPSIQIDGVDLSSLANASVTWYKTWSNTSGVSNVISNWTTLVPQNHTVTIYGLIDWKYSTTGNFAEDTSYQITLVANDSLNGHSAPITQTMSTAFYTIDFQAGGKEIAFGAPANDNLTSHPNGLFKCAMDAQFGGSAKFDGNVGFDGDVEFGGNVVGIRGSVIGEIKAYAGLSIPDGWLECDGSEVSKSKYPNLYAAIGDLWGVPNSSSNFKLPNLKGRVPVGHDSTDENFGTVGGTGGAKSRELCAAIGACNDGPSTLGYIAEAATTYQSSHGASYVVRGSSFESMRHWNHSTPVTERYSSSRETSFLQPYAVIKYIICAI